MKLGLLLFLAAIAVAQEPIVLKDYVSANCVNGKFDSAGQWMCPPTIHVMTASEMQSPNVVVGAVEGVPVQGNVTRTDTVNDFKAEKLKPEEIARLRIAQKEADEANARLAKTEEQIKEAHGQPAPSSSMVTTLDCVSFLTDVEIRGDWALITRTSRYLCGNAVIQ